MSEVQKSSQSWMGELEEIFQEYKNRLASAEEASNDVLNLARRRADNIIADTTAKAQQMADEIKQMAQQEAEDIVLEARRQAGEITQEADDRCRKEAKEKTRREVDKTLASARKEAESEAAKIIDRARKEAERMVNEVRDSVREETRQASAEIIAEAKAAARKLDEESVTRAADTNALMADVLQKAEGALARFSSQVQGELAGLLQTVGKARNDLEIKSVIDEISLGAAKKVRKAQKAQPVIPSVTFNENQPLEGRIELNILPPYNRAQINQLVSWLKQSPQLRLDGEAATEQDFSIYVKIVEPVPLLAWLRDVPLVTVSGVEEDTIRLTLNPSKNGAEPVE